MSRVIWGGVQCHACCGGPCNVTRDLGGRCGAGELGTVGARSGARAACSHAHNKPRLSPAGRAPSPCGPGLPGGRFAGPGPGSGGAAPRLPLPLPTGAGREMPAGGSRTPRFLPCAARPLPVPCPGSPGHGAGAQPGLRQPGSGRGTGWGRRDRDGERGLRGGVRGATARGTAPAPRRLRGGVGVSPGPGPAAPAPRWPRRPRPGLGSRRGRLGAGAGVTPPSTAQPLAEAAAETRPPSPLAGCQRGLGVPRVGDSRGPPGKTCPGSGWKPPPGAEGSEGPEGLSSLLLTSPTSSSARANPGPAVPTSHGARALPLGLSRPSRHPRPHGAGTVPSGTGPGSGNA